MKRYITPNGARGVRVGVSVSAKVGKAVVRNKIRRRLKEIFRMNQDGFRQGFDLVVVARDAAATAEYAEIERDLFYLAGKLGVTAGARP
jgi:ribonuclease P protein component